MRLVNIWKQWMIVDIFLLSWQLYSHLQDRVPSFIICNNICQKSLKWYLFIRNNWNDIYISEITEMIFVYKKLLKWHFYIRNYWNHICISEITNMIFIYLKLLKWYLYTRNYWNDICILEIIFVYQKLMK